MGRGGSNPPSDTTELPPSRPETSLFECHVEPWSAFDGHLQMVGIYGDGVQQLLHEDAADEHRAHIGRNRGEVRVADWTTRHWRWTRARAGTPDDIGPPASNAARVRVPGRSSSAGGSPSAVITTTRVTTRGDARRTTRGKAERLARAALRMAPEDFVPGRGEPLSAGGSLRRGPVRSRSIRPLRVPPGRMRSAQALAGFEGTTRSPPMICARRSSICGRMSSMNPPP